MSDIEKIGKILKNIDKSLKDIEISFNGSRYKTEQEWLNSPERAKIIAESLLSKEGLGCDCKHT